MRKILKEHVNKHNFHGSSSTLKGACRIVLGNKTISNEVRAVVNKLFIFLLSVYTCAV